MNCQTENCRLNAARAYRFLLALILVIIGIYAAMSPETRVNGLGLAFILGAPFIALGDEE